MSGDLPLSPDVPRRPDSARLRGALGFIALLLAGLSLLTPFLRIEVQGRVGLLLVLAALLEYAHGFRRSTLDGQKAAWFGGTVTLAMGVVLLNAPYIASTALLLFLAGWFALDGIRYLAGAFRRKGKTSVLLWLLAGLGNFAVCAALLLLHETALPWTVAAVGAVRIFGTASNIFLSPVFTLSDSGDTAVGDLGLPDHPELATLSGRLVEEELARAPVDRGWVIGFIATLFAIHLGRMGFDHSSFGILSPAFAVLGDLVMALALAYLLIVPGTVIWRRLTRGLERRVWTWYLAVPEDRRGWWRRAVLSGLVYRLRSSVRLRQARYSVRSAVSRGLQIGLPLAAVIAATVPVWGMSWYFDTENWAAGIWNSWAEERTDTWREAMARAVRALEADKGPAEEFAVHPPDVPAKGDFAFVVIGDTGEGDASQHSLRAQYLEVVRQKDVKFVVISSDVVYPTGAIQNYEANFWLPFMGTTKPVYAIPGNHDWYDALEGFTSTFLEPHAARAAMRARVEIDNRITKTTDRRIEQLIARSTRLRHEYGVPTQFQKAPFFQFQTPSFALFAVDTGVARRLDPAQLAWLRGALESARGKTKMAILGHPFYAGGHYLGGACPEFAELHALLREHGVAAVMAGDTHDLEHYAERRKDAPGVVHHFVNGGGGAYLSFGTALAWPRQPATADWAFYPNKAQVVAKIEETVPRWKTPAWWWTKKFGAWPFTAEWLSAAFDVNQAPFFQSFIEVRVEPERGRLRFIPHGIRGRLRWRDLEASESERAGGGSPDSLVEWVVPMRK